MTLECRVLSGWNSGFTVLKRPMEKKKAIHTDSGQGREATERQQSTRELQPEQSNCEREKDLVYMLMTSIMKNKKEE